MNIDDIDMENHGFPKTKIESPNEVEQYLEYPLFQFKFIPYQQKADCIGTRQERIHQKGHSSGIRSCYRNIG